MLTLDLGGFGLETIEYKTSVFPGGELWVKIIGGVSDSVKIYTRLNNSEEIMRLVMSVDALRGMGVKTIECVIPYIPYGRQDRRCCIGESSSLKTFSKILNSLKFSKIHTIDAHSHAGELLIDNLIDCGNSKFLEMVLCKIGNSDINYLSPDAGAAKKIEKTLSFVENPVILQCSKERNLEDTSIKRTSVPKIENDKPVLVIDDICDFGRTFLNIAKELSGLKNKKILCVTHGIFSGGFTQLLECFDEIHSTNSIHSDFSKLDGYLPHRVFNYCVTKVGC